MTENLELLRRVREGHSKINGGITATIADNAAGFAAYSIMKQEKENFVQQP